MNPAFEFVSPLVFGLERTAELLTRGFADYFVPIALTAESLAQSARVDGVDLTASRVLLRQGVGVGAALIARRGWSCRLAGMSLLPEARRSGIGRSTVRHLLGEARARGERAMVLEVIEQNAPAVALYESGGFTRVRRLVGFIGRGSGDSAAGRSLEEVDLRTMGAAITANRTLDLPWQLSGETLAHLTPPCRAFRLGDAWIAVAILSAEQVAIRGVGTSTGVPEARQVAALLAGVMAAFPGKEWRISALWPEEWSDGFIAAGLTRLPLSQWQMAQALV